MCHNLDRCRVNSLRKLIGFILFGDDQKIMKRVIKKNFFKIISTFLVNVFKFNIKYAIRFLDTFIFINLNKKIEKKIRNDNKNTELIIAGIKKKYQNKGVGTFFLNKIFLEYKNYFSEFEYVFLKTLPTTQNLTYYVYLLMIFHFQKRTMFKKALKFLPKNY